MAYFEKGREYQRIKIHDKCARVSVCPKCGNEFSFEDYMKVRFCPDCDTFLSNKIRYE